MAKRREMFLWIVLAAVLASCASGITEIQATWYDESFQGGPIKKVLVIAQLGDIQQQITAENYMKNLLHDKDIAVVSCNSVVSPQRTVGPEEIKGMCQTEGIDAILLTRFLGSERGKETFPGNSVRQAGSDGGFANYYDLHFAQDRNNAPRLSVEYEKIYLDNQLFVANTGELIWQVQTETINNENFDKAVRQALQVIASDLSRKGFFAGRN